MQEQNLFRVLSICVLLMLLFCFQLFGQQISQQKQHIAVLDFEGQGISNIEATTLTNRFRGELVNTGKFVVVECGRIEKIMTEQGLQLTGCTSTECAVEIGKILGAQKMIAGSIGKIGNTYTVNISFIDVESSQIEKFFNRDYQGEIDGLLQTLKMIAWEISGKDVVPKVGKSISSVPLYISGVAFLTSARVVTYSLLQGQNSYDKYKEAKSYDEMIKYKDDTKKYDKYTLNSTITTGISTAAFLIYYRFYKRSLKPTSFSANIDNI